MCSTILPFFSSIFSTSDLCIVRGQRPRKSQAVANGEIDRHSCKPSILVTRLEPHVASLFSNLLSITASLKSRYLTLQHFHVIALFMSVRRYGFFYYVIVLCVFGNEALRLSLVYA